MTSASGKVKTFSLMAYQLKPFDEKRDAEGN
jgi:hypothetical protein